MHPQTRFVDRLATGPPILLDGPTGTELQRRGVETDLPGWTAAAIETAPEVLAAIHRDYVAAGAEVLTANTFRTHAQNVRQLQPGRDAAGTRRLAERLTCEAVHLARQAAAAAVRLVWIAGSQAPIGDCYDPAQPADEAALEYEHRRHAEVLAAAGVDLILVETHPTLAEARAATRAALSTGLTVVTSFVCNRNGRLLSGESLAAATQEIARLPVAAIAVNCILADTALNAVKTLRKNCGERPIGIYANVGWFSPESGWQNSASTDPTVYAGHAADWLDADARFIGSCCGTTPEHTVALRRLIDQRGATQDLPKASGVRD